MTTAKDEDLGAEPVERAEEPAGRRPAGDRVPWLIALAVFAIYTSISVFRYLRLESMSYDLGIFTEAVKQYAHFKAPVADIKGPGFNLLGDHFHPILILIAPFFRLFPTAATLLVAQSFLIAISVIPVSRIARDKLGVNAGRVIAVAYGFSWGLQQAIDFDFHEIAFAVPLLAFSLAALVRRRDLQAMLWAIPLILVKEDLGWTVAALGVYMAVRASLDRERPDTRVMIYGFGLVLVGAGMALAAVNYIIPHFNPSHQYAFWQELGVFSSHGGHFTVSGAYDQVTQAGATKLRTVVLILLPTAFIALRSPIALLAIPSIAVRMISTNSNYWGTWYHYNATVMPIVFIAAIDAIAVIRTAQETRAVHPVSRAAERHGAAMMLAIAAAMAFQFPLNDFWNYRTFRIVPRVDAANRAMAKVPNGTTVETTLNLLAKLASRDQTFWIGNDGNPAPRYIVFDDFNSGWSPNPGDPLSFVESRHPGTKYVQIYLTDGIYVFRQAG